ncbi:MAG: hypothetical protein JRJ59_12375 [Deltaproteobacteria bacterium]|nr:hypothetical protein [Deltaproteobacteria bacterium]
MRLIALILASGLLWAWPGLAAAGPKMVLDKTTLDAGQAYEGQTIQGVFEVLNQGDADLIIQRVAPG